MNQIAIDLRSSGPSGAHTPKPQHQVTRVRTSVKIRFDRFMSPEIVEDCLDVILAKRALEDPSNRGIPWEQAKKELGL
jgi:hypothetical protein